MKIRQCYVSNSSSSSFIVACKPNKTTITLSIEVDLSTHGDTTITTKKELLNYFNEYRVVKSEEEILNDEYEVENYTTMLAELEKGNVVIVGSFSSEGDPLDQFLCDRGLQGLSGDGVTIIQSDAGY